MMYLHSRNSPMKNVLYPGLEMCLVFSCNARTMNNDIKYKQFQQRKKQSLQGKNLSDQNHFSANLLILFSKSTLAL